MRRGGAVIWTMSQDSHGLPNEALRVQAAGRQQVLQGVWHSGGPTRALIGDRD